MWMCVSSTWLTPVRSQPVAKISIYGFGCGCLCLRNPVGGHRLDAPNISRFIQFQRQQPKVFTFRDRDAVHDTGGDGRVHGKSLQLNRTPDVERMRDASGAPPQVYEDYFSLLGERVRRIETAEGDRNGTRNSGAVPLRSFLHRQSQSRILQQEHDSTIRTQETQSDVFVRNS